MNEVEPNNKPIAKHYEYAGEVPYIKYTCPTGCCKLALHVERDNYCPNCGIKLDWSEKE